jgi:hypothetical protein
MCGLVPRTRIISDFVKFFRLRGHGRLERILDRAPRPSDYAPA